MTQKGPAETLFNTYHRRILAVLLLRPEQNFYVRELARLAEIPPGSLHRELKVLAESGLLLREPVGNQVRYRANRDCPVFEELAGFFRKTMGLVDVLREALVPLASQIDVAFVFGSVAQGKERFTSDIDVFVIGTVSFVEVVQAFAQTHERLGREINSIVIPKKNFMSKYANGDRFVERVIKEPKLFIVGADNDLGKLIKDWPAQKPRD